MFLGNIDFAADDQGALSCCIHEGRMCLFIVCETVFYEQFPMQMTCTEQQAQQVAEILAGEGFPPKLLWRTQTKIYRQRTRRRQKETARQREYRLA